MPDKTFHVVQITGSRGEVTQPQWLARAELIHRQLRPQLPADYPAKMRKVFNDGGEM